MYERLNEIEPFSVIETLYLTRYDEREGADPASNSRVSVIEAELQSG